ncbi:MAG: hypothetical protein KF729_39190, partial [Sandaracinaceae bacterium]|nr:hypothetical protein [Sandaracinaceae bacterium]
FPRGGARSPPGQSTVMDPTLYCQQFCLNEAEPIFAGDPTTGRVADGTTPHYLGPGTCGGDDDSAPWYAPSVPPEAVWIGRLVPELSLIDMDIEGVGVASVNPSRGQFAISGATCDGTVECTMFVQDFEIVMPDFELGDRTARRVVMRSGEIDDPSGVEAVYTPSPEQRWVLGAGGVLPLDITGLLDDDPEHAGLEANWGGMLGDVGPEGSIAIQRGDAEKFIRLVGQVSRRPPGEDEGPLVTVDFDVYFRFFAGPPVGLMAAYPSPSDSTEVILDGRETWDQLGGGPVTYVWFAIDAQTSPDPSRPTRQIIARGKRASIPHAYYQALLLDNYRICLWVEDADGISTLRCGDGQLGNPPQGPPPGCADVGLTPTDTRHFGRLLDQVGWTEYVNTYPGQLTLVVPTDDMIEALPSGYRAQLFTNQAVARTYLSRFILTDRVATFAEVARLRFPPGPPRPLVPLWPDRGCGDGSLVHVVTR